MVSNPDPHKTWLKITRWCAYQERSQQEARDKLYALGLHKRDVEQMISRLITEGFINEERFAIAFAGGKFRILGWGKEKIKTALHQKKISEYCIKKALKLLDDEDYEKRLKLIISKKRKELKGKSEIEIRHRLIRYALSRGYSADLARKIVGDPDES